LSYPGGVALWVIEVRSVAPDVTDAGAALDLIQLSVDALNGVACEVRPATVDGNGLVEVIARPDQSVAEQSLIVTVRAHRDGGDSSNAGHPWDVRTELPLRVTRFQDTLDDEARQRLAPFVQYLAANHGDFGIDAATTWESWDPAPGILVVMWHSFLSDDWEALIQWHVMIPPHDWTRVYLRRRDTLECAWAGEISTENAPVTEITLPPGFPRFDAPTLPMR
jgi:hypothetical protein